MTARPPSSIPASSRLIARSPFFYGWVIWAVGTIGVMASSPGQSYSFALFLDSFIADYGLNRTTISALYGLGTAIAALSLTALGRLIDRAGNRRAGALISLVFAGIMVLYWPLIGGPVSFLIGVIGLRLFGLGALPLVSTTAVAQWFWRRRGRVMSLAAVVGALFRAVYVPAIQRVLEVADWRDVWLGLGLVIGAVMPALFWLLVRDRPEDYGLAPDGRPAAPSAGAEAPQVSPPVEANWTLGQAMHLPIFWVFVAGRFMVSVWITGLVFHQVSVFESLGHTARTAANTYGVMSLMTAVLSVGAGVLVDRARPGVIMAINMLALGATSALAMVMRSDGLLALYALAYAVTMGLGTVFDGAVWTNLFGRAHQGAIRGFASTALVMGTALGPVLFGLSVDALGSYGPALWSGVVLSAVPMVLSVVLRVPGEGSQTVK